MIGSDVDGPVPVPGPEVFQGMLSTTEVVVYQVKTSWPLIHLIPLPSAYGCKDTRSCSTMVRFGSRVRGMRHTNTNDILSGMMSINSTASL